MKTGKESLKKKDKACRIRKHREKTDTEGPELERHKRRDDLRGFGSVSGRFYCSSGVRVSVNIFSNILFLTSVLMLSLAVLNNDFYPGKLFV